MDPLDVDVAVGAAVPVAVRVRVLFGASIPVAVLDTGGVAVAAGLEAPAVDSSGRRRSACIFFNQCCFLVNSRHVNSTTA